MFDLITANIHQNSIASFHIRNDKTKSNAIDWKDVLEK